MRFRIWLLPFLLTCLAAPGWSVGVTGSSSKAVREQSACDKLVPRISSNALQEMAHDHLVQASIKAGPLRPSIDQSHRRNFPDPKKMGAKPSQGTYPWHFDITATYFHIGELASARNPVSNTASSWDNCWDDNYGGYDDPDPAKRDPITYAPKAFTPQLNPFYVALPYNDIQAGGPRPEAARIIPWYKRDKGGKYESVCRGTWVQIYYRGRYCFAQWEDVGPFRVDDWEYVFGGKPPRNQANNQAGIDISPAVRDYLGIPGGMAKVHWRFVDFSRVPGGPWARYGKDNPFVNPALKQAVQKFQRRLKNRNAFSTRRQGAASYQAIKPRKK